jgi:hypothetical protein
MKLAATIARSLQADMQAELRNLERAAAAGTREAGRGLRSEVRRQVTSAGLGQRLANSWRDKHYPNQKLDAASLVYSKAPQIIRAFDEGVVVRSGRGRFLAIPTENAPRKGTDGKRISPSGAPLRAAPVRASLDWPIAPGRGSAQGLVQPQDRCAAGLPARNRSSPSTARWSCYGDDVPAGAAGGTEQAPRRRPRGRALVGAAAGADRAAA